MIENVAGRKSVRRSAFMGATSQGLTSTFHLQVLLGNLLPLPASACYIYTGDFVHSTFDDFGGDSSAVRMFINQIL